MVCPGNVIDLRDNGDEEDTIYSLYINGELVKEDYIKAPMDTKGNIEYPYTVPENSYFVMGGQQKRKLRQPQKIGRRDSEGEPDGEGCVPPVSLQLHWLYQIKT